MPKFCKLIIKYICNKKLKYRPWLFLFQTQGGLLRIFPFDKDDYVDVAPIMNRMLFFWSDKRMPHEVQPAYDKRYKA